jgi:hypothetical protein
MSGKNKMPPLMHCPYCGQDAIKSREVEIQEIDAKMRLVKTPERLLELECGKCGWFGSQSVPTIQSMHELSSY